MTVLMVLEHLLCQVQCGVQDPQCIWPSAVVPGSEARPAYSVTVERIWPAEEVIFRGSHMQRASEQRKEGEME